MNLFRLMKSWFKPKDRFKDNTENYPYRHPLSEPEIKKEKPVKIKKERKPMVLSIWHKVAASTVIGAALPVIVGYVQDTNLGSGFKVGSIFAGGIIGVVLFVYCIAEGTKDHE